MILFIRPRPHCGFESTAFVHFHRLVCQIINYCHIIFVKFVILFIRPRPHCGFESTAFVHFHRLVSQIIVVLFW